MISKKEALVLGVLVIGGAGIAGMVNDGGGGGGGGAKSQPRYGAILGTQQAVSQPAGEVLNTYNIKQADVSFPDPVKYDISKFLQTVAPPVASGPSSGGGGGYTTKKESFDALQISLTQPLFSDVSPTFAPNPSHPSSGMGTTTSPFTPSNGASTAPIGTPAAQMPVYNPYVSPPPPKKEWGVGEGAGSAVGGGFTPSEQESYFAGGG